MIREIEINDYYKNYLNLLKQLTEVGEHSFDDFYNKITEIKKNNYHKIFVIEKDNKIVGSITCLIEPKFIRNMKSICHIEDFIVDKNYRGQGIGNKLLEFIKDFSKKNNCYKIILNCSEDYINFYNKKGFYQKNFEMLLRFL
jgi:glucosamine-phosphate N-acetyltransferase